MFFKRTGPGLFRVVEVMDRNESITYQVEKQVPWIRGNGYSWEPVEGAVFRTCEEAQRFHKVCEQTPNGERRTPISHRSNPNNSDWVSMTQYEIGEIMEKSKAYGSRMYEFARAIEKNLKEKNT